LSNHTWLNDIKVLSFDLDDTLWDCAPVITKAEEALFAWMQEHTPMAINQWVDGALMQRRAEVISRYPEFACDMSLLRHKMIELTLVDAGYPSSLTDDAYDVFYRARSEVTLYEGTESVLNALKARYKLAVITNGNADLDLIGLTDKFAHIQRASIDNAPKPQPQMFEACLRDFGIGPHQLAHIGDNVETDVGGAQAIGARTVWYRHPHQQWPAEQRKPDADVTSLFELQSLFIKEP